MWNDVGVLFQFDVFLLNAVEVYAFCSLPSSSSSLFLFKIDRLVLLSPDAVA
jgi:hypothetical protein